jgi:hypothetical protein
MDVDSSHGVRIDLRLADNANRLPYHLAMDGQFLVFALAADTWTGARLRSHL